MPKTTRILTVIIAALVLTSQGVAENPAQGKQNDQDRLEVVARFLRGAYPDLIDQPSGPAVLHVLFSNGSFGGVFQLSLYLRPCREGIVTGEKQPEQSLPNCGGAHPELRSIADEKPLLRASVHFSQNEGHPIVVYFGAAFTALDETLQQVRDQFKDRVHTEFDYHDKKRYWTESDALQALQSKNPRFGPDHKKEFLDILPINPLADLTGCRLKPESAMFVVGVVRDELPELKWHLEGDAIGATSSEATGCSATFEPFEGRLTSFSMP